MKPKDEAHINELLQQYKVRRIGNFEASILSIVTGHLSLLSSSFAGKEEGGETVLYLAPDEADDNGTYFIALHEIGHVALNHHEADKPQEVKVEHEIAAWEWALANAKARPSDSTLLLMQEAVGTYTDRLAYLLSPEREKEGVKAIVYLQGVAGMEETEEGALASWKKLDENRQDFTLAFYNATLAATPELQASAAERARATPRMKWDERLNRPTAENE